MAEGRRTSCQEKLGPSMAAAGSDEVSSPMQRHSSVSSSSQSSEESCPLALSSSVRRSLRSRDGSQSTVTADGGNQTKRYFFLDSSDNTNPLDELDAIRQKFKDAMHKQCNLRCKVHKGTITEEEKDELKDIDTVLKNLNKKRKFYQRLVLKDEGPMAKTFSQANRKWIEAVTGVNTSYRKWTGYVVDENIQPRPGFKTSFEEVTKTFHRHSEAGRRVFLNLFLSDVLLRPEFDGTMLIYPALELSVVGTNRRRKRKLIGKTDYAVGFGKGVDIIYDAFPSEIHLVAVGAKINFPHGDLLQCVAQASSLYKIRLDASNVNKSVWGILTDASRWQFIFIDDDGLLWQSDEYCMDLDTFDEAKALQVYRIVHYIVKCCYEASTHPPSTP